MRNLKTRKPGLFRPLASLERSRVKFNASLGNPLSHGWIQLTIQHLHNCAATWRESVPVHEVFKGETVWKGDVEVFDLTGHPKAKRCYGWSFGEPEEFITILELPPVDSPQSAAKVGVAYQVKRARK